MRRPTAIALWALGGLIMLLIMLNQMTVLCWPGNCNLGW